METPNIENMLADWPNDNDWYKQCKPSARKELSTIKSRLAEAERLIEETLDNFYMDKLDPDWFKLAKSFLSQDKGECPACNDNPDSYSGCQVCNRQGPLKRKGAE